MNVYLAARYSRRTELAEYAAELRAAGMVVTSRWVAGRHETPPEGVAPGSPAHLRWAAEEDIEDVRDADLLVAFTEPDGPVPGRGRGGRHVELGYAIAAGKRVVVCGHRENVFCHLPGVGFAPDWPATMALVVDAAPPAEAG